MEAIVTDLGLTGIGHIAIRVRDLDRMVAFYTGRLGLAEMFRLYHDDGSLWVVYLRITDEQYLELVPNGTSAATHKAVGPDHLCVTVADLDATVAGLTERGVALTLPLRLGPDGNRQAWIADPEGTRIELMEMSPSSRQAEAIGRMRRGGC
jgi:lactoylglutathione lyase